MVLENKISKSTLRASEINTLDDAVDYTISEIGTLNDLYTGIDGAVSRLDTTVQGHTGQLTYLQNNYTTLQTSLNSALARITALENQYTNNINPRLFTVEDKVQADTDAIIATQQRVTNLENKVSTVNYTMQEGFEEVFSNADNWVNIKVLPFTTTRTGIVQVHAEGSVGMDSDAQAQFEIVASGISDVSDYYVTSNGGGEEEFSFQDNINVGIGTRQYVLRFKSVFGNELAAHVQRFIITEI